MGDTGTGHIAERREVFAHESVEDKFSVSSGCAITWCLEFFAIFSGIENGLSKKCPALAGLDHADNSPRRAVLEFPKNCSRY